MRTEGHADDPRDSEVDSEVERALLDYLGRHPLAADTLEGIGDRWLPPPRAFTRQRVEDALRRLVDDGVLQMRRLPNGDVLYASSPSLRATPPP
jgi:hypothetical protein